MKKNAFSRGLALILCLSMILGFVPGGLFGGSNVVNAVVSEEATNVAMQLRNGSFDILGDNNLPKYWTVSSNIEAVADDRYGGSYSLKFTADGSAASIQQVIPVQSGMKVKLEAWGKQLTAAAGYNPSSKIYIGFQNDQNQWVPDGKNGAVSEPVARTTAWTPSVLEAEIPEGTTKILIEVCHDTNEDMGRDGLSYSYVVDDLVLTLTSKDGGQNTVFADSFDTYLAGNYGYGPEGWTVGDSSGEPDSPITCNPSYHPGRTIVQFQNRSCDIYSKDFDVVPGCEYTVSFDAFKTDNNTDYGYGIIYFKDAAGNQVGSFLYEVAKTVQQWVEETFCVVAPAGAAKAYLKFGITADGQDFALDNLVVTQSPEPAKDFSLNGDFEASDTEYTGWTKSGLDPVVVPGAGKDGSNALLFKDDKTNNAIEILSDFFSVEPDTAYDLSVWIKKDTTVEANRSDLPVYVYWYDANGNEVTAVGSDNPYDNYKLPIPETASEVVQTLQVPVNATQAKLRFNFFVGNVASVYLDDIKMTKSVVTLFTEGFNTTSLSQTFDLTNSQWEHSTRGAQFWNGDNRHNYEGAGCMCLQARDESITSKAVEVEAGKAYKLSFWTRNHPSFQSNNQVGGNAKLIFFDANGTAIPGAAVSIVAFADENVWTNKTLTAIAPANAATVKVYFDNVADKTLFTLLDAVSVTEAEENPQFPVNGDFDAADEFVYWTPNSSKITIAKGMGVDGTNALLVQDDSNGGGVEILSNKFLLTTNITYKFSMQMKATASMGNTGWPRAVIWGLKAGETKPTNDSFAKVVSAPVLTDEWQLVEGEFELPADVVCVLIQIDCDNSNYAYAYIDNVTITCAHKNATYTYNYDATCTANGTESAACSDCGETLTREVVGTEHVQTRIPYNAATPLAFGNIEYYVCSCGNWYEDAACTKLISNHEDVNIPMTDCTNHEADEWVSDNNATCTEDGTKSAKCKHCRTPMQETEVGTKHTQTHNDEIPTSEKAAGTKEHWVCSCGKKYYDEACTSEVANDADLVIERLSCDHVGLQTTYNNDATCTADGTETGHCAICDEDVDVPALGTKHTQTYVPSTATAAAYYACSCGNNYYDAACTKPANNTSLNFSFEEVNGDSPVNWTDSTTNNVTVVTPAVAPNGKNVLQIAGPGQSTKSLNLSVEAGKTYQMKVMAKDIQGGGTLLDLFVMDAADNLLAYGRTATDGSGMWKMYTVTVAIPEGADYMYIEFWTTRATDATTWIDNVIIGEVINETDKEEPDETEPTEPETEPTEPETEPTEPETEPTEPETEPTEPEETEPVVTMPSEIENGNFEEVTEDNKIVGWNELSFAGAAIDVIDEEGNKVVKFVADAEAGFAANIFRTELAVEHGTALTVELMSKLLSGSGDAYVAVFFYDENGVMVPATMTYLVAIATTEDWAETALTLNVPEGAVYAAIEIGNALYQTVSFLVDDVTVTKGEAVEEPERPGTEPSEPESEPVLLFFDDFSEAYTPEGSASSVHVPVGWISSKPTSAAFGIGSYDKYKGTPTLFIQAAGYLTSPAIDVVAGKEYTATFVDKIYADTAPNGGYVAIKFINADGEIIATESIEAGDSADWTEKTLKATAPEGAIAAYMEVGATGSAVFGIDDLTVYGYKLVEPETPDEDGIDLNFSFENLGENGLPTAWKIPNAGATINTTDKVDGNNALQIDAVAAAKTVQSYAIPVGKVTDQYEATFRVKRLSGESDIYMGIWFGKEPHKNYDNYCCEAVYAEDDNEWHEYTVSWGVYKDASYMWLEIGNHSGATVSYLIDNITLKINGEVVKTIKIDTPEEPEATEPEATEPEATEPEATEPEAPTEPTPTEPSVENNLIVNGEFEEGVGNWGGSVNAITSVNTDSHSGDKCMQFTDESKDAAYYVYQKVAVTAGKTYVLSAWVKQVSGPNAGYMGVYGLDNDNVAVTVATTGEWAYYEVEVTIPAGFSEATIEIGAHKSSMTTFLIDQIVFVEK